MKGERKRTNERDRNLSTTVLHASISTKIWCVCHAHLDVPCELLPVGAVEPVVEGLGGHEADHLRAEHQEAQQGHQAEQEGHLAVGLQT